MSLRSTAQYILQLRIDTVAGARVHNGVRESNRICDGMVGLW